MFNPLPRSYARDHVLDQLLALFGIFAPRQLFAEADLHCPFESHAAEVSSEPRDVESRPAGFARY